jgi:NitT/TauT family transport system ATP-binding protein
VRNSPGVDARVEDVTYRYPGGGVTALEGMSMTIPSRSCVAIIGPSGCGKSTLLQLLAGLKSPDRGDISWPDPPPGVHPIAMVFQTDTLLPWLTAAENVALHYRFRRKARSPEVKAWVKELLAIVGLTDFADAYPYQLSGGMRRRVAFLVAVAARPATLLLDEPFSSLDEPTRVAIHQDVLRIIDELEMTVVLVTHDLAEAITLSDEIVIMTRRPGHLLSRHTVPFGRNRNPYELRQRREFLEFYGTLWRELSSQMGTPEDEE